MRDEDDAGDYAELWLSELGAHVPEHHDGAALNPLEPRFGLGLDPHERARRHDQHLEREARRARVHRARSDPSTGRA